MHVTHRVHAARAAGAAAQAQPNTRPRASQPGSFGPEGFLSGEGLAQKLATLMLTAQVQ
jgi:hypothetical protein